MTALAYRLADAALAAAAAPDLDTLRSRTLWNLAAEAGAQDISGRPASVYVGDQPGSWALRAAMSMHARTQDDFYPAGRVHVGAAVLPAVLALGQGSIYPALSAGYEVLCAVSRCYSSEAQARGLRPTGVFGPLGAAAAGAVALGGDRDLVASAIALSAAMCGGTNQAWKDGSDEWVLQVGIASRAGVEAAQLAAAGVVGASRALEGLAGWGQAMFGDPGATRLAADPLPASAGEVAIKPFPVSGIAQVPTHLGTLAHEAGIGADVAIELRMNPEELAYPGSENRGPFRSRSDSLMSVARCVAMGLEAGAVSFAALASAPSPSEQARLDLITVVGDPALEETEAVLTAGNGPSAVVLRGSGPELLYPTWDDTASDCKSIARRTECSEQRVEDLAKLLAGDAPATDLVRGMTHD